MSSPLVEHSPHQAEWRDTFNDICDRHRGRLIRWVSAIFGPRDAEDIAQETLIRLYTRPWLIEESADAWPWLAVVARNVGRDLARHNSWSTAVDSVALSHVAADVVVLDEVVARDEGARVARALRSLTPRERHVIRLRDFEGASIAEIAELLGLTENAVRQQLFRARRRLANVYLDHGGDSRFGSLVAAFGMRLRELARRFTPYANEVGPPGAAAFGVALPGVAALVGGVVVGLVPGLGAGGESARPPGAVALATAARWDPRDDAVGHGTGLASTPLSPRPGPPAPPPPEPLYDVHEDIPFGRIDATHDEDPWSSEGGDYNHHYIYVDIPGTPWHVSVEGHSHEYPGPPTACLLGVLPCPP